MSFSEFITPKLIKVLYIILLAIVAIGLVVGLISGLVTLFSKGGFLSGLALLIGTPVLALIYVIAARVGMETTILLFRIAENTQTIANKQ